MGFITWVLAQFGFSPGGDVWAWVLRRFILLGVALACYSFAPLVFAKACLDRLLHRGYFDDKTREHTLMEYGIQWSDYMFNFLFLREALPSPYALQALYPMFDVCDDGVAVDFHEDFLCCMPKAPSPAPPAAPAASPQSPLPPLCASPSQSSLPSPLPSVSPLLPALHAASHRKIVDVRFIIVPGALVSPLAYAPVARALAGKGYPTYIARLPFNLGFWGARTVEAIVEQASSGGGDGEETSGGAASNRGTVYGYGSPSYGSPATNGGGSSGGGYGSGGPSPIVWVLAGHSLGAVILDRCLRTQPWMLGGVVAIGSSVRCVARAAPLGVPALVVLGSRDPFAPPTEAVRRQCGGAGDRGGGDGDGGCGGGGLTTELVVIEGGNHRGFAGYLSQPLDWEATISDKEQMAQLTDAMLSFVKRRVAMAHPIEDSGCSVSSG